MVVNLQQLYQLSRSPPRLIFQRAADLGLDGVVAQGVMKLLLANDGNLASLSARQRDHYQRVIEPLMALPPTDSG
jgi:hypothetical protein